MILLVACSLILTLVPIVHSQVNEPQNIQVVNKSWYVDLYGNLVVVGQIKNVGQDVIDQVILTGTATTTDQLQQSSYTNVWVSDLTPQQKAPFYMEFPPPQDAYGQSSWYGSSIADISINVALANATSGYQYPDLKITSSQGSVGTSGDFDWSILSQRHHTEHRFPGSYQRYSGWRILQFNWHSSRRRIHQLPIAQNS